MDLRFDFDSERTIGAIVYLASKKIPGLTKWKVCKLLYLSDRMHLARFGRPITGDVYYALPRGPIPSYTKNGLDDKNQFGLELSEVLEKDPSSKHPTYAPAAGKQELWKEALSRSDILVLDEVIGSYGHLSYKDLSRVVDDTPAYKKAWNSRVGERAPMKFEDFFEGVAGAHLELLEELQENLVANNSDY
jgi:uncharacterized phage-associated protein